MSTGFIIVPDYVSQRFDEIVADARAAHPDMTDDDASHIRQQLVNAFAEYGRIPEFEIVKNEDATRASHGGG